MHFGVERAAPHPPAYPLTKQHFQLENHEFALEMGNNVDCYLMLPNFPGYGKRSPAYHMTFVLRKQGNKILIWWASKQTPEINMHFGVGGTPPPPASPRTQNPGKQLWEPHVYQGTTPTIQTTTMWGHTTNLWVYWPENTTGRQLCGPHVYQGFRQ